MKCRLLFGLGLVFAAMPLHFAQAQNVHLSVDASKPGPRIDRNIFGQFAENLGHGLYEGIWVGPNSPIPNTRGIRNDVVAALRELKVPNVRWPGGCFADQYHWRNGIGPIDKRPATVNSAWGDVVDTNAFVPTSSWTSCSRLAARLTYRSTSARERHKKPLSGWST